MFSQNHTKNTKQAKVILDAIATMTAGREELMGYQDMWKPNDQGVIHPKTKQELPITYGTLRESISRNSQRLDILQRMFNDEPITKDEHKLVLDLHLLQDIPELISYPNIRTNGPSLAGR